MMKHFLGIARWAAMVLLCAPCLGHAPARDPVEDITRVLDAWHAAAARADETTYFSYFAPNAVFLGTDATERWSLEQFRAFAHPYFAKGKAWDFRATERHVDLSADKATAWFDELLHTANMGQCRGSGVLSRIDGLWKISQYNLSIPIPNDLADEFVARIAAFGAPADAATLKVMTFNIRYDNKGDGDDRWELRRDRVVEFLRAQSPDVVGLQEALHGQLEYLKQHLPEMGAIGVGRDDGKTRGEYAAILYRKDRWRVAEEGNFWFSDTPEVAGSKHWGNNVVRICTWARFTPVGDDGAAGFYLFNVHLDHESQPSRERSVVLLQRRVASRSNANAPAIVTGDFNAGERNRAIEAMRGLVALSELGAPADAPRATAFTDSYRSVHAQETRAGTFNAFKGERGGEKIDYIFVPPGVRVVDAEIHRERPAGRDLSDHFPVTAGVVIKAGAKPAGTDAAPK